MTNEVFRPVQRQLQYITLYGLVRSFVQHDDETEILSICDDIINENDWTIDSESSNTILETGAVLAGVYRWANRLPHSVFTKQRIADAQRSYGLSQYYLCDISAKE